MWPVKGGQIGNVSYEVPWNNPKASVQEFSPRGGDIDRNGVVWLSLASGHLASFDRREGRLKSRGVWSLCSTRALTHIEGGKGTRGDVLKFQVRADPLAR